MEFIEIYCKNCKKILGRYNTRYYSDEKIHELIKSSHGLHVREGHEVRMNKVTKS